MAIQLYQDRVVPTTSSPVQVASGAEAIQGFQNLASAVQKVSDDEIKLQDTTAYHEAYRGFLETQDTLQEKALHDPDIDNSEKNYFAQINKSRSDFASKVNNPAKRKNFYTQTESLMLSGGKAVRSHVLKQKNDLAIGNLNTTITNITNKAVATNDPLDQGAYFGILQHHIDDAQTTGLITPYQASKQKQSITTTFERSNLINLINSDPKSAIQDLDNGEKFLNISPGERINYKQQATKKLSESILNQAILGIYENQPTGRYSQSQSTEAPNNTQKTKRNIQTIPIDFETSVDYLIDRFEGGYVAKDGTSNAPANMGVNQKYNPDVDVANMTRSQAEKKHRETWDAIDADNLPAEIRYIAFDLATNSGADAEVKAMIKQAGNDPQKLIALRKQKYAKLGLDPKNKEYIDGWNNRINEIEDLSNKSNINQNTDTNTAIDTTDNHDDPTHLNIEGMDSLPPQMQMTIKRKVMVARDKITKQRQQELKDIVKTSLSRISQYKNDDILNSKDPQIQQDIATLQISAENGDLDAQKKLDTLYENQDLKNTLDAVKTLNPLQIDNLITDMKTEYDKTPVPMIRKRITALEKYNESFQQKLKSDPIDHAISVGMIDGNLDFADNEKSFSEQLQNRTIQIPSFLNTQNIKPKFFTNIEVDFLKDRYEKITVPEKIAFIQELSVGIPDDKLFGAAMTQLGSAKLASVAYYFRKDQPQLGSEIVKSYEATKGITVDKKNIESALSDYRDAFKGTDGEPLPEYDTFKQAIEPAIQVYKNRALQSNETDFNTGLFKEVMNEFVGRVVDINGKSTVIPYDIDPSLNNDLKYLTRNDIEPLLTGLNNDHAKNNFMEYATFTPFKLSQGLYTVSFGNAGNIIDPKNGKPFVINIYDLSKIAQERANLPKNRLRVVRPLSSGGF